MKDIALQMIEDSPAKDTDLIFGGGLAAFVNYDLLDPEERYKINISTLTLNFLQYFILI